MERNKTTSIGFPLIHPTFSYGENPTIRKALVWAEAYLEEKKIPDPRLSAEILMAFLLGKDRLGVFLEWDKNISERDLKAFENKVLRRAQQEPIAYLTGHKEFWSLDFKVSPAVLIPRPETELLVEAALQWVSQRTDPTLLVELGTGSGAITITLSKSLPGVKPFTFIATDLSRAALMTARKNAVHHDVHNVISFIQGNWLEPFSNRRRWIDLLFSNPPYISEEELLHLPETVKRYEPLRALSGGRDGLESIRTIFRQAEKQLKKGAGLILEIGENQGPSVLELAEAHRFIDARIQKDYSGKERILSAVYHG